METAIKVQIRDVYGRPVAYPANQQAERLADMVGTKTLTIQTLRQAKAMGFVLIEVDRRGNDMPATFEGGHFAAIQARLAG